MGTEKPRLTENQRLNGTAECPDCKAEIDLIAEPEAWEIHTIDGQEFRMPTDWGPGMGICDKCDLLFAEDLEGGVQVFDLKQERGRGKGPVRRREDRGDPPLP